MTFRWWERWGALAGALAIVLWIVAFIVASGGPNTNDSDTKITSYFTTHSHQTRDIASFFIFLAGVLLFIAFLSVLRSRLAGAEGGRQTLTAFTYGSGIASAVLWVLAISTFTAPGFAANDTGKFRLDPNTFRLVSDLGYAFWVAAVIVGALVVWGASTVAMRSAVLPRWFAWLGIVAGIFQLFALFFIPAFIFWGWILVASILLFWRRAVTVTTGVVSAP